MFESLKDSVDAGSGTCVLWNVFDDIRLWSEGEMFDDRLVWIECYGIHSKCWTKENVRKIG